MASFLHTFARDLDLKAQLDTNSEKIPSIKVIKVLARYLNDESKWEHIVDYLNSINIDFMALKEITDELLGDISIKAMWDKNQKELVGALFA